MIHSLSVTLQLFRCLAAIELVITMLACLVDYEFFPRRRLT